MGDEAPLTDLRLVEQLEPSGTHLSSSDIAVFRSANIYIELHGDDAVAKAREMVRTMRERGDSDGADRWQQIIVAIETVRQSMERGLAQ